MAGFVGRDRGYRALGFAAAGHLPLTAEPTVPLGADAAPAHDRRADDGWVLVVDDEHQPQGWLALDRASRTARCAGRSRPDLLNLGGTLATADGTLRAALDAALSSPSGRGVVVDDDGALRSARSPRRRCSPASRSTPRPRDTAPARRSRSTRRR